ncbi:MAG TPA: HAMP domain-containing sensor histidine kinase, partial [Aggregicoccus sp.]|nr:HAMP domain-containing sensor histidine kinase [Aggregicoccus sp.]
SREASAWELVPRARPRQGLFSLRFLSLPFAQGGEEALLLVGDAQGAQTLSDLALQTLRFNAELSHSTRELSRRSRELERAHAHLATLAHDIRSPLHAIGLNAGRIVREAASRGLESAQRRANAIQRIIGRTLVLIQNVLDAERLHAQKVPLAPAPLALRPLLRELGDTFEPIAAEAGVQLVLPDAEGPAAWVRGDRGRLEQVLSNLMDNAIRHSPRGARVSLELHESEEHVRCGVRDQGPGIPPERRQSIFGLFQQGAGRPGSAGLGLYIAAQLVALHQGRLWVEDSPPQGALFLVELPRAPPSPSGRGSPPRWRGASPPG